MRSLLSCVRWMLILMSVYRVIVNDSCVVLECGYCVGS